MKPLKSLITAWQSLTNQQRFDILKRIDKKRAVYQKAIERGDASVVPVALAYLIYRAAGMPTHPARLKRFPWKKTDILNYDTDEWGTRRVANASERAYFERNDLDRSFARSVADAAKSALFLDAKHKRVMIKSYKNIPKEHLEKFVEEVQREHKRYDKWMLDKAKRALLQARVEKAKREWDGDLTYMLQSDTGVDKSGDLYPYAICRRLQSKVIAQDEALQSLATIFYWHKKAIESKHKNFLIKPPLIVGETGSGKTHLIQTLCEVYERDVLFVDAASMVSTGIRGNSTDEVLKNILRKCDYNLKRAQTCVVVLDEIDKLTSSYYGDSVLNQLLRFVEGGVFPLEISQSYEHDEFKQIKQLDTSDMLFIFAGSFQRFADEKLDKRQTEVGFVRVEEKLSRKERYEAIVEKSGLPKELLGRIGEIVVLNKLDKEAYVRILRDTPHSPLKRIASMLESIGIDFEIEEGEIEAIAQEAATKGYGARALEKIVYRRYGDLLYNPTQKTKKTSKTETDLKSFYRLMKG